MILDELDEWAMSFEAFHARFADLFARSEQRDQAKKYLRGLLANVERKNGWQLALAPRATSLHSLTTVAATRYTVEQCIEEAKGETGLDHYEVRSQPSWYWRITLSMMAHAWLASLRLTDEGKKVMPPSTWPD